MSDRRATSLSRRGRATAARRRARPLLARQVTRPRRRRRRPSGPWTKAWSLVATLLVVALVAGGSFALARAAGLMPSGLNLSVLATWGTIEQKATGRAFVVREEAMLTAPTAGTVRPRVGEGERVRQGQTIVELIDLAASREVEARLAELDRKIASARSAAEGAQATDPAAAARAKAAYRQALTAMGQAVATGRTSAYAETWADLRAAARARALAESRVADRAQELQDLLAERTAVLDSLQARSTALVSAGQGIATFTLDGLEELALEDLQARGAGAVLRLRENRVQLNQESKVAAGDVVCKLVDPNRANLLMILPAEGMTAATEGDTVSVRFPAIGESLVRGRIAALDEASRNGTRMATVAIESVPAELALARWFDAELLLVTRSGVIVPRSVLVRRGEQVGVYVLSRTSAYFRPVTQLAAAGDDVLVQGIATGTAVARLPWFWALLGRAR